MKNVAIIGASGYVGSVLLQEALGRNLHVKAIVRHPEKYHFMITISKWSKGMSAIRQKSENW